MTSGRILETIKSNIKNIRHFQIAGIPNRNEPNLGEINYSFILNQIEKMNYSGWIGCEYHPIASTTDGLIKWAKPYGIFGK